LKVKGGTEDERKGVSLCGKLSVWPRRKARAEGEDRRGHRVKIEKRRESKCSGDFTDH